LAVLEVEEGALLSVGSENEEDVDAEVDVEAEAEDVNFEVRSANLLSTEPVDLDAKMEETVVAEFWAESRVVSEGNARFLLFFDKEDEDVVGVAVDAAGTAALALLEEGN
jgi:hypothetical protein